MTRAHSARGAILAALVPAALLLGLSGLSARAQVRGAGPQQLPGRSVIDPTLTVNGLTSTDNNTVVHVVPGSLMTVELTGTPGAPFSLYFSRDAFDGSPGEPDVDDGFYLHRWIPNAEIDSPIHPVFEGIGTSFVAGKLDGYTLSDFVPVASSPVFHFDAQGKFNVSAVAPAQAVLQDVNPAGATGPGTPIIFPLESAPGFEASLFLQVVAFDGQAVDVVVGNGMKLIFDAVTFPATVYYSEGQDANSQSFTMGSKQTLGRLTHVNLADGNTPALDQTGSDFAAGGFPGATDIWMVTLAGASDLVDASVPPNSNNGLESAQANPDFIYTTIHGYGSNPEVFAASKPARNNENPEYPRITLPGNRDFFHWRNGNTNPVQYGFGVLYKDSGRYRNLTPQGAPGGPYTGTATLSPWEIEVGISPDGNRAIAVLDSSALAYDKVYLLNLEENGVFANGLPIIDVTPADTTLVSRVFEESIVFAKDVFGGWVGFLASTKSTSTLLTIYPDRLWKVPVDGTSSLVRVLPTSAEGTEPARLDRNPGVSADYSTVAVIGGAKADAEDVWAVTAITRFSHAVQNVTAFPVNTRLMESNDATDSAANWFRLAKNGKRVAFAAGTTAKNAPFVAATNGVDKGVVAEIVRDISFPTGLFDTAAEFANCQELFLTDDGSHLLFFQGLYVTLQNPDLFDLFTYDVTSGAIRNRTRTIKGPNYTGAGSLAFAGPWDVPATTPADRPNIDPAGSLLSPGRGLMIYGRDGRNIAGKPTFFTFIAVDVSSNKTFDLYNIFGTEFERSLGEGKPAYGAAELRTNATFSQEPLPSYFRLRRVGGTGSLKNWYYLAGMLAVDPPGGTNIEQLFLFDAENPGPALQLTAYNTGGSPFAVQIGSTLNSITPSQVEPKVAYMINQNGNLTVPFQEMVMQDLDAYATPVRLPDVGGQPAFNRTFTKASLHWLPTVPSGLVYMAGTLVRPAGGGAGATDGVTTAIDVFNPIDANPVFYSYKNPSLEIPLAPPPVGSNRRAGLIWGLRQ